MPLKTAITSRAKKLITNLNKFMNIKMAMTKISNLKRCEIYI